MKSLIFIFSVVASVAIATPVVPANAQSSGNAAAPQASGPGATFFFTPFAGLPPTFNVGPAGPATASGPATPEVTAAAAAGQNVAVPQFAFQSQPTSIAQHLASLQSLGLLPPPAQPQPQQNAAAGAAGSPQPQQAATISHRPVMPVELAQAYTESNLRLAHAYREAEQRLHAARQKEASEALLAQAIAGASAAAGPEAAAAGEAGSASGSSSSSSSSSSTPSSVPQQQSFLLPLNFPLTFLPSAPAQR